MICVVNGCQELVVIGASEAFMVELDLHAGKLDQPNTVQ